MNKLLSYTLIVFAVVMAASCSTTKFVPKDKYLLNKVSIKSDVKSQSQNELKQYVRQTPNSRSLGLFRIRLGIYDLSGRDTTKRINRFFRKIGDEPVIYDDFLTERSVAELKKYLNNKGYVHAEVNYDVKFKRKKAKVTYHVRGNEPYRLRNFTYYIRNNDTILHLVRRDSANTFIRKNMRFDIDVLNAERQRITGLLRMNGYYNFNVDYLHYLADSSLKTNQVDVRMILRQQTRTEPDGTVISTPQKQYTVRKIRFYTSYDPIAKFNTSALDSIQYNKYTVFFNKRQTIRPGTLAQRCYIDENKHYNEWQVEKTSSALSVLPAISYVNISFREIAENSDTLDCYILTSPAKQQSYSFDIEGTNSNGDLGFAGILGYRHKNLFKGSELFKISLRYAYEARTGYVSDFLIPTQSANEVGTEISLTFPNFLFPFLSYDFRRNIRASTEFNAIYNYQQRPEFTRTIASMGMKYHWSQNKRIRHTVNLVDVNYVYLPYISSDFLDKYIYSSSILRYSYENHLIVLSSYTLHYSGNHRRDNIAARIGLEAAGNTLSLVSRIFDFPKREDSYTIGNIKFDQYVKTDFSFSYNKYIDQRNNLVYHVGVGVGIPYGNAYVLPFEKRYISGGANSVRGWLVRTLGPGTYKGESYFDLNQVGDIKLDLNLEYRFKMFWKLEGALFSDAGNIWTLSYFKPQAGGEFFFNEFYRQIALSYGTGLRFDFSYFLIRVDMGIKTFNPALSGSDKWRFKGLNWEDDFAFHFAVGYPF